MPCMDYSDRFAPADRTNYFKEERDKLARIACSALTMLESMGISADKVSKEAATWFPEHKKQDQMRIAEEKRQAAAKAAQRLALEERVQRREIEQLRALQAKYGRNV